MFFHFGQTGNTTQHSCEMSGSWLILALFRKSLAPLIIKGTKASYPNKTDEQEVQQETNLAREQSLQGVETLKGILQKVEIWSQY